MPTKPNIKKAINASKTKIGRKPLGDQKRTTDIMVRLNAAEKQALNELAKLYNINLDKRGQQGPFVRRLLLQKINTLQEQGTITAKKSVGRGLPRASEIIAYEIHKIGVNINQLTRRVHQKNKNPVSRNTGNLVEQLNNKLDIIYKKLDTILKK